MKQEIKSQADQIINLLTKTMVGNESFLKFRGMEITSFVKTNFVNFKLTQKNEKGFKDVMIIKEKGGYHTVNFYTGIEPLQKEDRHEGVYSCDLMRLILNETTNKIDDQTIDPERYIETTRLTEKVFLIQKQIDALIKKRKMLEKGLIL